MTNEKTRKREINSLLQGAKKFHCQNLTIITFAEEMEVLRDNYIIKVIPVTKWLLNQ